MPGRMNSWLVLAAAALLLALGSTQASGEDAQAAAAAGSPERLVQLAHSLRARGQRQVLSVGPLPNAAGSSDASAADGGVFTAGRQLAAAPARITYTPAWQLYKPKAATSVYCIAKANALANKEAQQMATITVPAATNNAAVGTWAALAKGAALSVAGPAASRMCPTAAAIKATAASAAGKVGTVCCAAKAACEYKAMDVYFMQTALTVSALPDSCTLAVSLAANAVRVNVYNANYKGTAVGSLVNKAGSVDLRKYMVKGANRVVLTLLNNRCKNGKAADRARAFATLSCSAPAPKPPPPPPVKKPPPPPVKKPPPPPVKKPPPPPVKSPPPPPPKLPPPPPPKASPPPPPTGPVGTSPSSPPPPAATEIQTIEVQAHNEKRAKHQATGNVTWDTGLASGAQSWASGCHGIEHSFTPNTGENTYYSFATAQEALGTPAFNFQDAVDSWYSEIEFWNFTSGMNKAGFETADSGHFTQVVWTDTTKVGCGSSYCPGPGVIDGTNYPYGFVVICQYLPPGNVNGPDNYIVHVKNLKAK